MVIGRLGFAFLHVLRLFQSFLCQGLATRVLRLTLKSVVSLKEYVFQNEKSGTEKRFYMLCWEGNYLKKICVRCQSVDLPVPDAELVPLARVVHCLSSQRLPFSVVGGSASLLRVSGDNRDDDREFMCVALQRGRFYAMFPASTPGHLRHIGSVDSSRVCDSAAKECGLRRLGGGQTMFEKMCSGWIGGSDKTVAFNPALYSLHWTSLPRRCQ